MRFSFQSALASFDVWLFEAAPTEDEGVRAVAGSPWTADAHHRPHLRRARTSRRATRRTPQDGVHRMSEAHAPALTEALHTLRSVTYVSSETARTAAALERIADLLEADRAETAATRRRT